MFERVVRERFVVVYSDNFLVACCGGSSGVLALQGASRHVRSGCSGVLMARRVWLLGVFGIPQNYLSGQQAG